ncbi:3-phosphoserine/phosphohydroxythreonine transaminase [Blochmannia endosymbiont of Colobopsis nipponica]|uniref:3-phosphoserine/phosphohydroxythreonine transaminase n=1 Tax=Blochmannia endosymbiont of Colobopsis nipponica TaxID=2681987 RepID=UPI001786F473|nr:3-phosphoserine/phosphohydroxythreonine transaminase [Blochmannia endosymbiont of Colobopsis nipponica]QOI11066.1 3-phosphoserine/phosphohydroxythreonine transaminase [Blochmannia endosymbiont of Colobopsis nipponica]
MRNVFNFSAGPAMLPAEVLQQVQKELLDWRGIGASIMEISHRSQDFIDVAQTAENDLREILDIPVYYKVLFCQGGARAQFAAVPMNLLKNKDLSVDYINSGYWSYHAANEAKKYCNPHIVDVTTVVNDLYKIQPMRDWSLSDDSFYIHYCPNETIEGLSIDEDPNFKTSIVIGDFSSTLLSRPLNISKFGIIYAAAQKNIGLSGLTVVIVREDLLGSYCREVPSILNYQLLANNKSMFNTPPTFSWYIAGLVFKWLKKRGGLVVMNKHNKNKASLLYSTIDKSGFYFNNISPENRSLMNVPFRLINSKLEDMFLKEALDAGLYALKGHRLVGGIRASLYNAMPLKGVQTLVEFMNWFSDKYG